MAMAMRPIRQRDEFVDYYGLIWPWKYDLEDLEEYDYAPDEEDWFGIADPHQAICKYLKQVRTSFGFDVDCRVPSWFDGTFCPIDVADAKLKKKRIYDTIIRASEVAILEINKETGLSYEFVEVEKSVLTTTFLHLLTITVTVANADADDACVVATTIQAIVFEKPQYTFTLEQWRIKPAAATSNDSDASDVVATSYVVTSNDSDGATSTSNAADAAASAA